MTTLRAAALLAAVALGSIAEGQQPSVPRSRYEAKIKKWGYVTPGSKTVITARFDQAGPFSRDEGLAAVEIDGQFFYINTSGDKAFAETFEFAGEFSGGVAPVARGGKFALIDTAGRAVTKFDYDALGTLSDGLARARVGDQVGFIDKTGRWKVRPVYESAGEFSQKRAWVKQDGKVGFIDPDGRAVVQPQFEEADGFNSGMAAVKNGGKFGYVEPSGKLTISPKYDKVTPFKNNDPDMGPVASVFTKGAKTQIDTAGKSIAIPVEGGGDTYTITTAPQDARVFLVPKFKIPPRFLARETPRAEWEGWMTVTYGGHDSPYTRKYDEEDIVYVVICEFTKRPGKPIKAVKFHPGVDVTPFKVNP